MARWNEPHEDLNEAHPRARTVETPTVFYRTRAGVIVLHAVLDESDPDHWTRLEIIGERHGQMICRPEPDARRFDLPPGVPGPTVRLESAPVHAGRR